MSVYFTFHFASELSHSFTARETTSEHFAPLFDTSSQFLSALGFWNLSFVKEYRADRQTMQEWLESQSEEELAERAARAPDVIDSDQPPVRWGPSAPFDGLEARAWASVWINILDDLTQQELVALFPMNISLITNESIIDVERTLSDLRNVVGQAEFASSQGVEMTLSMVSG